MGTKNWLHVSGASERHPTMKRYGRVGSDARWQILHSAPLPRSTVSHICPALWCRHVVRASGKRLECSRCSLQLWRLNHPEAHAYGLIRERARRKKISFEISWAEFRAFLQMNPEYLANRGRFCGNLHLDRIDALEGYTLGNIRVLGAEENSRKGATDDKIAHWLAARQAVAVTDAAEDLCPF